MRCWPRTVASAWSGVRASVISRPWPSIDVICALGHHRLVTVLVKCHLPLPRYLRADEKHSTCLTERVSLPTIVSGRVLWHLGYSDSKSAGAFHRVLWRLSTCGPSA